MNDKNQFLDLSNYEKEKKSVKVVLEMFIKLNVRKTGEY